MRPFHERYRGLVFDCDGTLVDTMPTHFKAWTSSLNQVGIPFPEDRFYSLGGVPAVTIIEMLAAEHGVRVNAVELAEEKEALFVSLSERSEPIAAVADIARQARGIIPMAVATGSPTWLAERLLKARVCAICLPTSSGPTKSRALNPSRKLTSSRLSASGSPQRIAALLRTLI